MSGSLQIKYSYNLTSGQSQSVIRLIVLMNSPNACQGKLFLLRLGLAGARAAETEQRIITSELLSVDRVLTV